MYVCMYEEGLFAHCLRRLAVLAICKEIYALHPLCSCKNLPPPVLFPWCICSIVYMV